MEKTPSDGSSLRPVWPVFIAQQFSYGDVTCRICYAADARRARIEKTLADRSNTETGYVRLAAVFASQEWKDWSRD